MSGSSLASPKREGSVDNGDTLQTGRHGPFKSLRPRLARWGRIPVTSTALTHILRTGIRLDPDRSLTAWRRCYLYARHRSDSDWGLNRNCVRAPTSCRASAVPGADRDRSRSRMDAADRPFRHAGRGASWGGSHVDSTIFCDLFPILATRHHRRVLPRTRSCIRWIQLHQANL